MSQTINLDIRGQICPSCLLLTLKELNQHATAIRSGNVEIVITTDDRQATTTIPATAERMGFATEVAHLPDGYRLRVFAHS